MRRRAKADGNQTALVKLIRDCGASFQHTHTVPGALDGIVGYMGIDQRVEIKDPAQPPCKQKLTDAEQEAFDEWKGRPPIIIKTEDDVFDLIRQIYWECTGRREEGEDVAQLARKAGL